MANNGGPGAAFLGWIAAAAVGIGCGVAPPYCHTGDSRACPCVGTTAPGVQTCNGSGDGYGACVCPGGCVPNCGVRTCGNDGCGGSCGMCGAEQTCSTAGVCGYDPGRRWILALTSGTITANMENGGPWDFLGNPPDASFCIRIDGFDACKPGTPDTFNPRWTADFGIMTTEMLQSGLLYSYRDLDDGRWDAICPVGEFRFTTEELAARTKTVGCVFGTATLVVTLL